MTLAIALAQINPTVGAVAANAALIRRARDEAAALGADLVVFSELAVVGYPPEDLVLRPALVQAAAAVLGELELESAHGGPGLVVTLPWAANGRVYNAAALVADGRLEVRFKHELPNYGVFDEKRVFAPGPLPDPVVFRHVRVGLPICEDIWLPACPAHLASKGAELLLVPNGSPFEVEKFHQRLDLAGHRVVETGLPLVYVNQVGGQDELVFDGGSFVMNQNGTLAHLLPFWREALVLSHWRKQDGHYCCDGNAAWSAEPRLASIYSAMMLGLRDYVGKNGFRGIVLGLSGGIDSALTAAVAVDALGADRVRGVRLPSRFTSEASSRDAADSAEALGIPLETVSIEPPVAAFEQLLGPVFSGRARDVTEENLQARARGVLLMALSNKFGDLLVTTGNKSEMSVGYATLYGDMCGGYSVLKDVYKTEVYALARWRNANVPGGGRGPGSRVIPESSLTKAPTAELRPNQTDQDTLPPYEILDAILNALIEEERSVDDIVARGFARETVTRVQRLLYTAEYKRRQAPPGVKITRRSFGRDRRYPLTNAFRES
ncbi:MAG: NAD+ synthase [Acidobacteria bacterium RIFCSPLOWO2_02_FULL_68_18]|nr:MAG: NAD+ synthase [Acidobacteria bacterium RIFCSPLOWO2_02_FULL_68_18]OFW51125.1 MAG: NAD+ synthase [Acidobacteria bacterium RIFCSPLOWO2_12_FULL_68_19]